MHIAIFGGCTEAASGYLMAASEEAAAAALATAEQGNEPDEDVAQQ